MNYESFTRKIYTIEALVFEEVYETELGETLNEYEVEDLFNVLFNTVTLQRYGIQNEMTYSISYDARRTICKFYKNSNSILLLPWGMNPLTICHEVAHYLTNKIAPDLPGHGPTFMSIFISLCIEASPILGFHLLWKVQEYKIPYRPKIINTDELCNSFMERNHVGF